MKYNFDEIIPRRHSNSVKWDMAEAGNLLPMWVADMDFKAAPPILEALKRQMEHGVFGYTFTPPEYFAAISRWWEKRHGFSVKTEWMLPVSGIIPALSVIIRSLAQRGDSVLLITPVYNHFFISIENCGCNALENELIYEQGKYSIDFVDLEKKAADPKTKLLLLSNPHNPVGRVFTKTELLQIAAICLKHEVVVVADEIHADLVYQGFQHVPFASLGAEHSNNSITCCSPSKPFNLAGIQAAYLFTENENLRKNMEHLFNTQETVFLNAFASTALIAAYEESEDWLEQLKIYLYANFEFLKQYVNQHLPQIRVTPLQATYLVWLDISSLGISCEVLSQQLTTEQGLWLNAGTMYGKAGEGFLRMNIGCPRALLEEGLKRLKKHLEK